MSFIKLDRKLLDWEWFEDSPTLHLWIYLLLKANHKEKTWQTIRIGKGQMVTSEAKLSSETGLSRQQVRTALKKLISTNEITKSTTSNYTIITVNKWAEYQCSNQEDNQPSTREITSGATTTKEIKNIRNKEFNNIHPSIEDVRAYCQERKNSVDPERWINYYTSNGWKVGKNPMKDWKAAVRTWERNSYTPKEEDKLPVYDTSNNVNLSQEEEDLLLEMMKGRKNENSYN